MQVGEITREIRKSQRYPHCETNVDQRTGDSLRSSGEEGAVSGEYPEIGRFRFGNSAHFYSYILSFSRESRVNS